MRRHELEHAIRAATEIIATDRILVIGSQAILGSFDEDSLPAEATASEEVDMAPMAQHDADALATKLDAAIGEWSPFHQTHGFYVQGVGRETAVLPVGWEERLVAVSNSRTRGATGYCLEPHDLCLSKLAAARAKDFAFVGALLQARLIDLDVLAERAEAMRHTHPRTQTAISDWLGSQRRDHTEVAAPPDASVSAQANDKDNKYAGMPLGILGQQPRVRPGQPGGGQFSSRQRAEGDVELSAPPD